MKKTLYLLIVLLLSMGLFACGSSDDDDSNSDDTTTYYSIGGALTVDGEALANVLVELGGDAGESVYTDEDGYYTFSDLEAGDYTVTPSTLSGYTYDPETIEVTLSDGDIAGQDFEATRISAAQFLYFTLPDQTNFLDNYPEAAVDDEAEILFSDYTLTTGITYEDDATVSGYALDQFVDADDVRAATPDPEGLLDAYDARQLYAAVVVSNNDGFDNRTKFVGKGYYNYDMRWDQFITGYLLDLNYSAKTFFPGSLTGEFPKMYNNKYAYHIYLFRKIDVKKADAAGTLVSFEVKATTESYVDDSGYEAGTSKFIVETLTYESVTDVEAISLDQFITTYITDSPSSYAYDIVALDDTVMEDWTYEELQNSYYLPDWDLVIQLDSSGNPIEDTKLNFPVRIELVGATVDYDGSANPAPAYAIYNEDDNGYSE